MSFHNAQTPEDLPPEHLSMDDDETPTHSHPCARCQSPVECCGMQSRNYDGWPETICLNYHLEGGIVAFTLCESCQDAADSEGDE